MNSMRIYICNDCEKTTGIPLVRIPDWNKKCLLCNSKNLSYIYDFDPNAPKGKRITIIERLVNHD